MKTRRKGRAIDGLLLLDKTQGLTSNRALQQVKRLMSAAKAGHTGSLDPLATGMLPICFGEATKFCQYLLEADKRYEVIVQLGVKTTTGDTEGEILETRTVPDLTDPTIEQALETFRGQIYQVPSMYSAIKYQGKPLYEYARQGIEVPRESRKIHIYQLQLAHFDRATAQLHLTVHCSKGTYIRNLAEDLGEVLAVGAHVIALRRVSVAHYHANQMVTFDHLAALKTEANFEALDHQLISLKTAFSNWPMITVSETMAFYLRRGEAVWISKAPSSGLVSLLLNETDFLGLGEIQDDGKIKPKRLIKTI